MQVEDHGHAIRREEIHVRLESRLISGAAKNNAVDSEPTVLIQWDTHGVDVPGLHRVDTRLIGMIVEAVAPKTGPFGTRAIGTVQLDGLSGAVHEMTDGAVGAHLHMKTLELRRSRWRKGWRGARRGRCL